MFHKLHLLQTWPAIVKPPMDEYNNHAPVLHNLSAAYKAGKPGQS